MPDEKNFALAPIVVSSYAQYLSTNGQRIQPPNTNVVNRLMLNVYRSQNVPTTTNMELLGWQSARLTDLQAWQAYYRARFVTNYWPAHMRSSPYPGNVLLSKNADPQNPDQIIQVDAITTNEFSLPEEPQSPADDVLLALGKYDGVIEELRQAAQRPLSRFPLSYGVQEPLEMLLPHHAPLHSCVHVLSLRASAELGAGKPAAALADIQLILRLTESIRTEPFLFAQTVRVGWFNYAMQPIWEGVVQQRWTEPQLAELESSLAQLDFLADFAAGIRAQCAADVKAVEYCRVMHNSVITDTWGDGPSDFRSWLDFTSYRLFPDGWYALGKKAVCQAYFEGVLPAADLPQRILSPEKCGAGTGLVYSNLYKHMAPWNFWARLLFAAAKPSWFAQAQTEVDLARLACALERYRQAHGDFPETLAALSPAFIREIRGDVINGQPLHYRRTLGGKFLLYSVGWNGRDDGGVPGVNNYGHFVPTKGDWVWMFPMN